MACGNTGEECLNNRVSFEVRRQEDGTNLLIQLDVLHHLQCECKVTEENMYSQQTDNAEVPEHTV
jgi:hypothetical protein